MPEYFNLREAAKQLNRSYMSIYMLIRRGVLPAPKRIAGKAVFTPADINKYRRLLDSRSA